MSALVCSIHTNKPVFLHDTSYSPLFAFPVT
jgi:hypothetical protein